MIAKPLNWEPFSGAPAPWGAMGILERVYWANDNGNWDSDPENSGPDPTEAAAAQTEEDRAVLQLLSEEAINAIRAAGVKIGS